MNWGNGAPLRDHGCESGQVPGVGPRGHGSPGNEAMSPTLADSGELRTARRITQDAIVLTAFLVLQKLLSLVQQVMIGRVSGLSAEADAFYIAQTAPLLGGAVIMVALTTTLIPSLRSGDERRATGLFLSILALLALGSVLLFAFAPGVVGFLGHGLPRPSADTAARLLREMAVLILFQGAAGILNALYYRRFRFVIPSIASCLLYVGAIIGVALRPWTSVDSFAFGMVAGGALQVVLLCSCVGRLEAHRPIFGWRALAGFSRSFLSILIASAGSMNLIVDRAFASFGQAGTVTGVTLASGLITIPSTMVVFSLNSALLPSLVNLRENREAFAATFRHAVAYMVLFLGPANLILFFGSASIIRLLFHSARFDVNSIRLTSLLVVAYSVGIFGTALREILSNALISLRREWIAMAASIAGISLSIMLKLLYLSPDNPTWIASSTSIAAWSAAGILFVAAAGIVPVNWRRFWRENGLWLGLANGLFLGVCLLLRRSLQSQAYTPLVILAMAGALYLVVGWRASAMRK